MGLFVCGINHKRADLAMRERCAVSEENLPIMLQQLQAQPTIVESIILSTCNRTEIIGVANDTWPALPWMADYFQIKINDLPGYHYEDTQAITHLMEVASGLDSMVLGENQILGQIKRAYDAAKKHQTTGDTLDQLLPIIFATGKAVRHQTDINRHVGTIPCAIKQIMRETPALPEQPKILYLGASAMNNEVACALQAQAYPPTYWINRTYHHAQTMAEKTASLALPWGELSATINNADVIISATASNQILINAALLAQYADRQRPLLIIDLALPRDVHDDVRDLNYVYLFNLDDLQSRIEVGKSTRKKAANDAKKIIQTQLEHYQTHQLHYAHGALIANYRAQAERLRQDILDQALEQIHKGIAPEKACEQLSKQLTARLLHHPTLGLRDMIERSDGATLACLAARLEKDT